MRIKRPLKNESELQRLAEEAATDWRTVLRVMVGLPVKTRPGARARVVLVRHHIIEERA